MSRSKQDGFTIIELMIVVVLSVQIVGALSFMVSSHRSANVESARRTQVDEAERRGVAQLERDLRAARSVRQVAGALVIQRDEGTSRWAIEAGGLCRDGRFAQRIRNVRAIELHGERLVEVRLLKAHEPPIEVVVHLRGAAR